MSFSTRVRASSCAHWVRDGFVLPCCFLTALAGPAHADSQTEASPDNEANAPPSDTETTELAAPEGASSAPEPEAPEVAVSEQSQNGTTLGAQPPSTETTAAPALASDSAAEPKSSPPSNPGARLELGARAGYGIPYGEYVKDAQLSHFFKAAIPLQVDVWVRFEGGFAVGIWGQLAPGSAGQDVAGCSDCSVLAYSYGLQGVSHFNSGGIVDPWLGLGLGVEGLDLSNPGTAFDSQSGRVVNATIHQILLGLPQLVVQAGVDFGTKDVAFGPWVSASWARASSLKSEVDCAEEAICGDRMLTEGDADIADASRANHYWVQFGLRGTYLH